MTKIIKKSKQKNKMKNNNLVDSNYDQYEYNLDLESDISRYNIITNTVIPKKNIKLEQNKLLISPKVIITKKVQQKISTLCNLFMNIEWSGVMFYTTTGEFNKDMVITIDDILPKDVGSSTRTEYDVDASIPGYMCEKGLTRHRQGHIHSHHSMETNFSGTDFDTLEKEGDDSIHFLSLIVNNNYSYTAAITTKKEIISEINTTIKRKSTQKSFNNIINENEEILTETSNETSTLIEYCYTTIEFEDQELVTELLKVKQNLTSKPINHYSYTKKNNYNSYPKNGNITGLGNPNIPGVSIIPKKEIIDKNIWYHSNLPKFPTTYSHLRNNNEINILTNFNNLVNSSVNQLITINVLADAKSSYSLNYFLEKIVNSFTIDQYKDMIGSILDNILLEFEKCINKLGIKNESQLSIFLCGIFNIKYLEWRNKLSQGNIGDFTPIFINSIIVKITDMAINASIKPNSGEDEVLQVLIKILDNNI